MCTRTQSYADTSYIKRAKAAASSRQLKKKIAVQKELAFVAEKMNKLAPLVGILITIPASPKILRALAKCSSRLFFLLFSS